MIAPVFLRLEANILLHERAVRSFGGLPGVRDQNGLRAALARAEHKFFYAGPNEVDLFDLAAAYAFGIARAHPFNDGNKRAAWSACVLFLARAGITAPATAEVVDAVIRLASGETTEQAFAEWLRATPAISRTKAD